MGVYGAHNTVRKISAHTTLCVREAVEYCSCRRTGYGPWYRGFDFVCPPCFLCMSPGPYRAGVPGRLVPFGSDCVSWRGAVSRGSAHPRSEKRVGVGSSVGLGLPVGEAVRRQAGDRSEHSDQRGGPKSETGAVPPRPGLSVGDWIVPLACRLGTWAGP